MNQRALGLSNRTSLDLAVALRPMFPLAELVRSALLERTSNVKEPLVPTVTSPVKELVSLSKVRVAPSATICARRVGAAIIIAARITEEAFMGLVAEGHSVNSSDKKRFLTGGLSVLNLFVLLLNVMFMAGLSIRK